MKTQKQLNILPYEDVIAYRRKILRRENYDKRYIKELEIYTDERFKERCFERYEEWFNKKDIDMLYKISSDLVEGMGRDNYYSYKIEKDKQQLGKSIYDLYV